MPTYRPAKAEEYQECLQVLNETAGYLEPTLQHMQISVDQFAGLFRSVGQVFTVREADDFAGFYWIERRDNLLHLHGLVLSERFQGKAIGTQILRRLEAQYHGSVEAIELGAHESNDRAIKLYTRLGYRTVKRLHDLGRVNITYLNGSEIALPSSMLRITASVNSI